jgi:hypothetical protein
MTGNWRKNHLLRVGILLFVMVFVFAAAAGAVVCQKMANQGKSMLPCPCCHVAVVIHASPVLHVDCVIAYVQIPVVMAPVLIVSPLFHPPRV